MKNLKTWCTLLLALSLLLCATMASAEGETYKVGILQYVEHPALDEAEKGFVDALKDGGLVEGENLTIDRQNASGDQAALQLMSDQLIQGGNDLLLGIATPSVQALAVQTEIPVLGTAVTDYVGAELVASNEAPGINVSGTTDMNPIDLQMALLMQLVPEAKTVGLIYTNSEVNSQIQGEIMKAEAEKLGLTVVEKTISAVGEVQQATESFVGQVDAIYAPTDNIIASAMTVVGDVAVPAGIPVITGETNMCIAGGLATYGLNYYKLGYQTGQMALRVLLEGANPAEMPIESLTDADLVINTTTASALGIEIPAELLEQATLVE